MTVEVLYIDGCPNHASSVRRVKAALEELAVAADLIEVPVADSASALALHFLGSPTIRVDGIDIEPSSRNATQFGLTCRTYVAGSVRTGIPPVELIRTAILEANRSVKH